MNAYKHACWLDMQAIKPGNVSIRSGHEDLTVDDFYASAEVSALPLFESEHSLGSRILLAVTATHEKVGTNTNLGIILLIAPMVQAAYLSSSKLQFIESLGQVLEETTVQDAVDVYQAIRICNPGGMGEKEYQDVSKEPTVSLLNTMKISQSWDRIAWQYAHKYEDILKFGVPAFEQNMHKWGEEQAAVSCLFLKFLAKFPDSLIERKFGLLKAKEISAMISGLEKELCRSDSPGRYEAQLLEIDSHLKRYRINPGTTADLTVASVFATDLLQLWSNS